MVALAIRAYELSLSSMAAQADGLDDQMGPTIKEQKQLRYYKQ